MALPFKQCPIIVLAGGGRTVDSVIIENTEISGQNAFEEIINLEDLRNLEDPLKSQLIELARSHAADLTMSAGG